MSHSLAIIVGGVVGGITLILVIVLLCCCMSHCKKSSTKGSETASSNPSALVEWNRGGSTSARDQPLSGPQAVRHFTLEELEQATKQFSESNLIGEGSFGLVYKGLLHDGTVVAVKRHMGVPQREFVEEVAYLSEISHRHLVTILGYSQQDGFQMLVSEYIPNGSVCDHLHGKSSDTQLDFKRRLSIALGAAKGLCHLHSLSRPLIHQNFNTSNVLVDENFIAKVADAGIIKLLERIDSASHSSRTSRGTVFHNTEKSGVLTEMSDVHSFGVFLLEVVSGEDLRQHNGSGEKFMQQVKARVASHNIVDSRLAGSFTSEGMKGFIGLILRCMNVSGEVQPNMAMIVSELERLLAKEMAWKTVMGEGTATVTLGSQLFTAE